MVSQSKGTSPVRDPGADRWSHSPTTEESSGAGVNSWPCRCKVSVLQVPWRFPGPASLDGQYHSGLYQHGFCSGEREGSVSHQHHPTDKPRWVKICFAST